MGYVFNYPDKESECPSIAKDGKKKYLEKNDDFDVATSILKNECQTLETKVDTCLTESSSMIGFVAGCGLAIPACIMTKKYAFLFIFTTLGVAYDLYAQHNACTGIRDEFLNSKLVLQKMELYRVSHSLKQELDDIKAAKAAIEDDFLIQFKEATEDVNETNQEGKTTFKIVDLLKETKEEHF
mmetsp:Transcript_6078/g.8846  ORF Transcript_6078/g.8846 Transcript_6078/m.8846 type:complete len:183 (-) Transcript_6078:68-616(-)